MRLLRPVQPRGQVQRRLVRLRGLLRGDPDDGALLALVVVVHRDLGVAVVVVVVVVVVGAVEDAGSG